MIQYFTSINQKLTGIPEPTAGCWINIKPPIGQEELDLITKEHELPPDFLTDALDSEERVSTLLGPIKSMVWQQNCGADKTYFQVQNPTPHETNNKMGWFSFTPSEKQKIDKAELIWFKRSIVSSVLKTVENDEKHVEHLKKYKPEEIESFLDKGYEVARNKKIYSEDGLRFFLINSLYYPDFMNSKDAARIVSQEHWLEPKKLNQLKEMLENYKLEHTKQLSNS